MEDNSKIDLTKHLNCSEDEAEKLIQWSLNLTREVGTKIGGERELEERIVKDAFLNHITTQQLVFFTLKMGRFIESYDPSPELKQMVITNKILRKLGEFNNENRE